MEVTNEMRSQMASGAIELDSSYNAHLTGISLSGVTSGYLLYNGETLPGAIQGQSGMSGLIDFTEKHISTAGEMSIVPTVWPLIDWGTDSLMRL